MKKVDSILLSLNVQQCFRLVFSLSMGLLIENSRLAYTVHAMHLETLNFSNMLSYYHHVFFSFVFLISYVEHDLEADLLSE